MSEDNPRVTLREYLRANITHNVAHPEVVGTISEYVLLAKLILLEHRVRDFSAADVVSLACLMESRDRDIRKIGALMNEGAGK